MRVSVRTSVAALSLVCLAGAFAGLAPDAAFAQAAPAPSAAAQAPQLKQIALTEKQIDGVLAAQKDIDVITEKLPDNAPPDQKVIAQLEAVAKKHGFASYDEYNNVVDNVSLVLSGIDPQTKKYIGSEAVIRQQIAQLQADKQLKTEDKKEALEHLDMALKAKEPEVENKANIDLVIKYYDKLAALGEDVN